MRNIELKARLVDLDTARKVAGVISTKRLGPQHQIDTYFHCSHGRLKLRQIDGLRAELIWYNRADEADPKPSDYQLVPLSNPETLKAALAGALGVRAVVEKRREIFLYHAVRIHLDDVVGLGHFLEHRGRLGRPSRRIGRPGHDRWFAAPLRPRSRRLAGRIASATWYDEGVFSRRNLVHRSASEFPGLGSTAGSSSSAEDAVGQANRGSGRFNFFGLFGVLMIFGWATAALAGGGPEGVLLVVNPQSPSSLTIANHYARLHNSAPARALSSLGSGKAPTTDIDTFRRQILIPVLQAIENQRLAGQIDYVVYSSDFPWWINVGSDIVKVMESLAGASPPATPSSSGKPATPPPNPPKPEWPIVLTGEGSPTGLTYLWQQATGKLPPISARKATATCVCRFPNRTVAQPGFPRQSLIRSEGEMVAADGCSYFLSAMFGVTAGHGNRWTKSFVIWADAAADGTHPKKTIYSSTTPTSVRRCATKCFPPSSTSWPSWALPPKSWRGRSP